MREEMGGESPRPVYTRDIPGLREFQKPFTSENAKAAEEIRDLPRMSAHESGLENEGKRSEWKSTPDMFSMERQDGIEAYEAHFRMKIAQPRPAVPHEHGQMHAKMG